MREVWGRDRFGFDIKRVEKEFFSFGVLVVASVMILILIVLEYIAINPMFNDVYIGQPEVYTEKEVLYPRYAPEK